MVVALSVCWVVVVALWFELRIGVVMRLSSFDKLGDVADAEQVPEWRLHLNIVKHKVLAWVSRVATDNTSKQQRAMSSDIS